MGLSDDQKAMLRLLAQREQGYEDIAALMGLSVPEVRAKVADALAQLEEEGKEVPAVPEAPQQETPKQEAPKEEPAPAPKPPQEKASEPAPEPAPAAPPPPPPPPKEPGTPLTKNPAFRAALAAGAVIVALVVVILVVSGGSDGDSASTGSTVAEGNGEITTEGTGEAESESETQNSANKGTKKVTKAVLEPVDGSQAAGIAVFGRVKNKLALQVEIDGLEPTGKSDSYTLWLAQSPQRMLPLASTAVPKSGKIAAQFEVPVELLAYLASETFDQLVVTHTDNAKLKVSLARATKEEEVPTYTGEPTLSGTVTGPIVGIAKRAEEAEKAEKGSE